MSNDNTDKQAARALRRIMPKPVQRHKDKNRYNRKQKHRGRSDE